jgi:hypothetical protein
MAPSHVLIRQSRETDMYPDSRVPRIPLYFASEGADVIFKFLFPGGRCKYLYPCETRYQDRDRFSLWPINSTRYKSRDKIERGGQPERRRKNGC